MSAYRHPAPNAAQAAKTLLHSASRRMMTADPTEDGTVSRALDQSLDWPVAARAATRPFEPSFAETDGRALSFQVQPTGRGFSAADQREITDGTARSLIYSHFGAAPLRFYDERSEGLRARYGAAMETGARYGLGLDASGLREVVAHYEWGASVTGLLPPPVLALAQTALQALPGLEPFATSIRTSRMAGGQQVSFNVPPDTSLEAFRPLMDALGMGHRHGGFTTLAAFVLGARFSLPAGVATLTLLNSPQGPELRLDVNIDALPDAPEQLLPLLRLPMTERPQNLAALDRWMTAMTPDGYYGPGSVTVLSIRVKPSMPARLALFLRPIALDDGGDELPAAPAAPIAATQAGLSAPRHLY